MKLARDLAEIEAVLLIEAVHHATGFDFREYAPASIRRRIWQCVRNEGLRTISGLQDRALHDPACMARLLRALSVITSGMFRDPSFYRALREQVVPLLREQPFIYIWHPGCGAGEEVYSMVILLEEVGLAGRCRLYATDMNEDALEAARRGVYPLSLMRGYTANYQKAEGARAFSDYYSAAGDHAIFHAALQKRVVWAAHNLVTDATFHEFHVVICRNVMIYFNLGLRDRVHELLYQSLAGSGVLGLGSHESLRGTVRAACYEALAEREKLYRKVR